MHVKESLQWCQGLGGHKWEVENVEPPIGSVNRHVDGTLTTLLRAGVLPHRKLWQHPCTNFPLCPSPIKHPLPAPPCSATAARQGSSRLFIPQNLADLAWAFSDRGHKDEALFDLLAVRCDMVIPTSPDRASYCPRIDY